MNELLLKKYSRVHFNSILLINSWVRAGKEMLVYFKNALVLMRLDSVKEGRKAV